MNDKKRSNPMPALGAPHIDRNATPGSPVTYGPAQMGEVCKGFAEGARRAARLKGRWQEPLARWQERELPCEDVARQKLRLALGAAEECGEVARCVLKGDQDIRGGAEAWREKLGGEIGDVIVYLMQLAMLEGLDIEECIDGAVNKVLARRFATAEEGTGQNGSELGGGR